ncbi:hypothetical protein [Methylopila turkensis]|uniref:Uncharacterized protein n=1 Tax=Methylopila turkensis TaxID=1437816 RepID=A0A9W6JQ84_9HYPH|nr:hypothetical protein [Methylopila turkensis]GLK79985.1 hypothetical protein GCM10008174_17260 [Methylopila turkensis]
MAKWLKAPVMALYHGVGEPLIALRRRRARLAAFVAGEQAPPVVLVDVQGASGPVEGGARDIVGRYVEPVGGAGPLARRLRLTPMAVDLARFEDMAAFERALRKRSSRTLPKVRKALKAGYAFHRFPLRRHVYDIHRVKTSTPVRAAGPVLDYWFLAPEDIAPPAMRPIRLKAPENPERWSLWFGVFVAEPGHMQGAVTVDERLVAYMKLTRVGELAHYTDLMGHADHLEAGVMWLLHVEIMRWLIESGDPLAAGVRVVLYGAAEHGGEGLLTWKKRAGFEPVRLVRAR